MKHLYSLATFLGAALLLAAVPSSASAQVSVGIGIGITVRTPPPALPVYVQPPCPAEGFLWTPGYWAYGEVGYYWVPGVWVRPPRIGVLWTPGYWGFAGGVYGWHAGYWGPHVGFYGGLNYGFGYSGVGFAGGVWEGGAFRYNTAVMNVNTTVVHNTYVNRTVINNTTIVNNRASFNGPGGAVARPTAEEQAALREPHVQPTTQQFAHEQNARADRSQWASANGGHPANVAMNRINGRRFDQQGRIANGIASGQMNAREAARAENRQASINHQIQTDRAAHDGRLTPNERRNINERQNNASRQIYREKHNERVAAK